MPFITIVYVFRDRDLDRVKRSLDSLSRQTDLDFDVIFVDFGSRHDLAAETSKLLSQYGFAKYVYNDTRYKPWNRSHALNTGIRLSNAPFIFTADVDMIFREDFISRCKSVADPGKAHFFSVYYLPEGHPLDKIEVNASFEKSKAYALGLAMISLDAVTRIGGYDEFYCYWGKEDNDIEFRLRKTGVQTVFYDDHVLLYHIYHKPVPQQRALIPDHWMSFQDSYFKAHQSAPARNLQSGWGEIRNKDTRKVTDILSDLKSPFLRIEGRSDYFRYFLERTFIEAKPGEVIAVQFVESTSSEFERSFVFRMARAVSNILQKLRIPLVVESAFSRNFEDIFKARDHAAHFVAVYKEMFDDFGMLVDGNQLKMVVIKK